jgi:hypothetical protein
MDSARVNEREKFCQVAAVNTQALVTTPSAINMDLATRLAAVKIDDAASTREGQVDPLPAVDHKEHSCLNPKLPIELECIIYSHLSIRDLSNLTLTYPGSAYILGDDSNSRQVAREIIARDTQHLRDQIEYLNFTGMSLVTAFRRYIRKYGLQRHTNYVPYCLRFSRAYLQANQGLYRDEYEVRSFVITALMISDWLQCHEKGTACTPLAAYVEFSSNLNPNWKDAFTTPFTIFPRNEPRAYAFLVEMWQQELGLSCSPEVIIQIFQEVRTRPLVNLPEFPKFMSPYRVPMNLDPEDADRKVWEIPDGLRERLDVPKTYFGLSVHVCTFGKKGRHLIRRYLRHGDQSGLLLAELMKELDIVWK